MQLILHITGAGRIKIPAGKNIKYVPQPLHLPPIGHGRGGFQTRPYGGTKPRQSGLAGEELLHGGLFEVALLGDELVEYGDQGIHIRQRGGDGALFGLVGRKGNRELAESHFID